MTQEMYTWETIYKNKMSIIPCVIKDMEYMELSYTYMTHNKI